MSGRWVRGVDTERGFDIPVRETPDGESAS